MGAAILSPTLVPTLQISDRRRLPGEGVRLKGYG